MTTNAPQPTNEDLEHKLDEIKTAFGIRTTTTSSVLDDFRRQLNRVEQQLEESHRRQTGVVLVVFSASVVLSGVVLAVSQQIVTTPWLWGLIIIALGIVFFVITYYQFFVMRGSRERHTRG